MLDTTRRDSFLAQERVHTKLGGVNPAEVVGVAKDATDAYIAIREASKVADIAKKLAGFKALSSTLGFAGAFLGLFFPGGGPDPEILKLQQMVRETQTEIALGNQAILEAVRKLNSDDA